MKMGTLYYPLVFFNLYALLMAWDCDFAPAADRERSNFVFTYSVLFTTRCLKTMYLLTEKKLIFTVENQQRRCQSKKKSLKILAI